MLNPIRLVEDIFDDKNLSYDNLRSFSESHLIRLSQPQNNPGSIYSDLITATTTKYNAYYGKITNEATQKAIAEGTTITRNDARTAAEEKIDSLQGLVKYKFGEGSAIYQEFYPLGITEYTRAREGDITRLFNRFVGAATTHLTADHPDEVEAITTLVEAFDAAYTARETAVANVDIAGTGKHADRKALTLQLTTNFLTIALNNLENPDKYDDYYDPRWLPISGDNGIRSGVVEAGGIKHISTSGLTINADTTIKLKNNSTEGNLRFYFATTDGEAPGLGATPITVLPNEEITKTAAELGLTATAQSLNVQNMHEEEGKWHVVIG